MNRMKQYLHLDCMTCTGKTIGEEIEGAEVFDDDVIRPLDNPVYPQGALAVLYGNLAPGGAVIKASACSPFLQKHTGPALVFDDYPSYKQVADRDAGVGNGACVLHVSPEAHVGGGIMGLFDVIVIGAGVTGCAVARELSRYRLKIGVLEKEADAPYPGLRRRCDCYQSCE